MFIYYINKTGVLFSWCFSRFYPQTLAFATVPVLSVVMAVVGGLGVLDMAFSPSASHLTPGRSLCPSLTPATSRLASIQDLHVLNCLLQLPSP